MNMHDFIGSYLDPEGNFVPQNEKNILLLVAAAVAFYLLY
jgi:hypothetical protein